MLGVVHVVDDDASFRAAIERRLKKAGYEVATHPSAQHLLDHCPMRAVQAVSFLMCGTWFERSGAASRLSELGSTLPIVFLTGYAMSRPRSGLSRRARMTS